MRICSKCQIEKLETEFYKGKQASCKDCDKVRSNKWKSENKSRKRETNKAWYLRNKEKVHNVGMSKYGITTADYDAILKAQNNCCKICNSHESKFTKKLAVDHCHSTGEIRGLLCTYCNRGLGFFKDNIGTLEAAILFLKQFKK
jgi:hypothetical protein